MGSRWKEALGLAQAVLGLAVVLAPYAIGLGLGLCWQTFPGWLIAVGLAVMLADFQGVAHRLFWAAGLMRRRE